MLSFNTLKLGVKLSLMLAALALTGLGAMGAVAYRDAHKVIDANSMILLQTTLANRKSDVENWSNGLLIEAGVQGESLGIQNAVREFTSAWSRLEGDPAAYLDKTYGVGSGLPPDQRDTVEYAGDLTDYSIVHRRYHASLRDLARTKGLYDLYLIDVRGNVLYSVAKQSDFGANVLQGPLAASGLAHLVGRLLAEGGDAAVASDFAIYAPSGGVPAAFVAAPVKGGEGQLLGVIAFHLNGDGIDALLNQSRGLGETGQVYLVGFDGLLRSNLRLSQEQTLLMRATQNDAVARALKGEAGASESVAINGGAAHLVFDSVDLLANRYAIVLEQQASEVFAPISALARTLLMQGAGLMLTLIVVAWGLARSLSRPLRAVVSTMSHIATGELLHRVPHLARGDEIGECARALENFRTALIGADKQAQEGFVKGAAFEGTSAAMMMTTPNFDISYVNPAMASLVNDAIEEFRKVTPDIDAAALVGRNIDTFHKLPGRIRAILSNPENLPYHADISLGARHYSLEITLAQMPGKGVLGYVVEWRDVTQARLNVATLNAIDRDQITASFNPDWRLCAANANLLSMLGKTFEDVCGRAFSELMQAKVADEIGETELHARLAKGDTVHGRITMRGQVGEVMLDGSVTPVLDTKGAVLKNIW